MKLYQRFLKMLNCFTFDLNWVMKQKLHLWTNEQLTIILFSMDRTTHLPS